jgi:cellulose synthase/poly-beta-1,6-N-acetylglucosamine synthase-like glycosyltransferase
MPRQFVTILIDTYNHQLFIEEAIESVLKQDFPASETEILVVDDGSTDNTPELVRKFAPRVRLLRKINGGQASAFNAGISEARGEIVAFLDGDDWWAPAKLTAVTKAFAAEADVGLVGHGITEVFADGRQCTQVPREICRFRIASTAEAKMFRMRRGFLGTSRMAYRREILHRIGCVPEALKFEADEYLFTLAGLFADVLILPESYTFYRLHDKNLFQITSGDAQAVRRKQQVLAALAQSLQEKLKQSGLPFEIARIILECVEVEADVLRLEVDSGFPWETISTELTIMRVFHSDASIWQHLFSYARLIPAAVLPARAYYSWRRRLAIMPFYQAFRRKLLPFPVPGHVDRREKTAP